MQRHGKTGRRIVGFPGRMLATLSQQYIEKPGNTGIFTLSKLFNWEEVCFSTNNSLFKTGKRRPKKHCGKRSFQIQGNSGKKVQTAPGIRRAMGGGKQSRAGFSTLWGGVENGGTRKYTFIKKKVSGRKGKGRPKPTEVGTISGNSEKKKKNLRGGVGNCKKNE